MKKNKSTLSADRLEGSSFNKQEEILNFLKSDLPEIFSEGKIDCKKLKQTLGGDVDDGNERYGLNWAGKSNCFRVIQEQTTATLRPAKDESVNFDDTQNLFIEGDNLEVLKVLQRSYYGKVKMIYIDPPYNTGGDFIYNDDFRKTKKDELIDSGEMNEEGDLNRADGLSINRRDSNGHFHSDWLNMMYPRLFLAKNLLRQDGVIFVSIDDNEVHNLRMVMDEIFGEENFEGHIHWRRRHNQPNDPSKLIALVAEHILVYSKNSVALKECGVGKLELTGKFSNPDNDLRGEWNSKPWKVGSNQSGSKYAINLPSGKIIDGEWMGEEKTFLELLRDNRIYFPNDGDGLPRKKIFKNEREREGQVATNWFEHQIFGHNQEASDESASLFDGIKNIFDNPKPTKLIKNLIRLGNVGDKEIIVDFFAGSGSTAQAVMEQNSKDGGNRKWVCVQLPELCEEESEAYKAGYKTIAEISKERIRRAGEKIKKENENCNVDSGFKVFKLDKSNFKIWQGKFENSENLLSAMEDFVDNVEKGSTEENILFELIIKSGLDLNIPIEKKEFNGDEYYSLDSGKLIVYLGKKISKELAGVFKKEKSEKFICLDGCFQNNDQLKTNISLQMEQEKIDFKVI